MLDISYLELENMMDSSYSMNYDDDTPEATEHEHSPPLQLHARMFALRERYDIPGLRDLAVKRYFSRFTISLEFMEPIYDFYRGNPTSVPQLRNAASVLMRKDLLRMLAVAVVATDYKRLVNEIPEFTKEVLEIYVKAPFYGDCRKCGPNQTCEAFERDASNVKRGGEARSSSDEGLEVSFIELNQSEESEVGVVPLIPI